MHSSAIFVKNHSAAAVIFGYRIYFSERKFKCIQLIYVKKPYRITSNRIRVREESNAKRVGKNCRMQMHLQTIRQFIREQSLTFANTVGKVSVLSQT